MVQEQVIVKNYHKVVAPFFFFFQITEGCMGPGNILAVGTITGQNI